MPFFTILFCIALLVLLVSWLKVNPFLAFLLASIAAGLLLGIPIAKVTTSVQKGLGDTLGQLAIIVCLGAMLGKLIAASGAAQKIAEVLIGITGEKYIQWGLMATGFITGLTLFYGIGFVLVVPLIFSVTYKYKLPAVYTGLPMVTALSVTHGFLPPHPSPVALIGQFHADIGRTLVYGLIIAIPTIILAGPVFASTLKGITAQPLAAFRPQEIPAEKLPGAFSSFMAALLPVLLIMLNTLYNQFHQPDDSSLTKFISFFGDGSIVMLIALIVATITLGIRQGKTMLQINTIYADAVKDIALVLLIIAGAGAFKQVLTDSGISDTIAEGLKHLPVHPLVAGWLIAAVIRICLGSSTVAGLTAAGMVTSLTVQQHTDPNLMVLAIGAGSLAFSHFNDSGFWLFKEYFNLSIKDTLRSWSMMESIVAFAGLAGVMLINAFI
ncbi:gluconate transporter [Mucilaginibacter koreensis]